ncbi:hypothetical protein H6CHR_01729 [Variovorax sp. PBL-H6]|nr:hypothetical protein H6CHR_01729 [Variovorax sp. PBL-H6]
MLLCSIRHDEADDCLHVSGASLERNLPQNIRTAFQHHNANQFVDERLRSLHPVKIEDYLATFFKGCFDLSAKPNGPGAATQC